MRDVVAAFDAHRVRHGISISKQSGLGFHAIVSISSQWLSAAGDLHDAKNPRNRKLLQTAVAWMETWCGTYSVYAGRLDLDETGGGNVDLFVMPARIDGRTSKLTIATSKALTELRKRRGERMAYVALQDDWAEYAAQHLDPAISRGRRKAETTIEHLQVEEFKAAASEASKRLRAAATETENKLRDLDALLTMVKQLELTATERSVVRFAEQEAGSFRPDS